jgi:hypothetical protein
MPPPEGLRPKRRSFGVAQIPLGEMISIFKPVLLYFKLLGLTQNLWEAVELT